MPRKPKVLPGPSHLSKVLANLNAHPRLELSNLRSLKLTLASRNDHLGARHFLKEQLPRIRWANPSLDIQVEKAQKAKAEAWKPEIELQFINGQLKSLNLQDKWSTSIVKELMDTAGADSWFRWKAEAKSAGLPIIPGEEKEVEIEQKPAPSALPSLKAYRASLPPPTPRKDVISKSPPELILKGKEKGKGKGQAVGAKMVEEEKEIEEIPMPAPRLKTGAAAVLP